MINIQRAAVIGAGTMGAQIAAHLANVGIRVLLLDVASTETPATAATRNRNTQSLFDRMRKLSPPPFFVPESANLVTIGNVEDHLDEIRRADWILEAVLEELDLKRNLHGKISSLARPDTLITTNTSGLPIESITQDLPEEYRRRFFATHFFNPPRYMRLLELVPNRNTDAGLIREFSAFAQAVLGKGTIVCKDTPGFIANRIGCYDLQNIFRLTFNEGLRIEEVDAITGHAMGRPPSATFRLGDIVGVDLLAQMGRNLQKLLQSDDEKMIFLVPGFIEKMISQGWWGEKRGAGFYKKTVISGKREILALDLASMEYRTSQKPFIPVLETVSGIADPAKRICALCHANDKAGRFAWKHLSTVITYAARLIPEISDDVVSVDRAMRWGYNWDLGPFEIWDALGVAETAGRLESEGQSPPPLVQSLLKSGHRNFYEWRGSKHLHFSPMAREYTDVIEPPKSIRLAHLFRDNRALISNAGASLVDLGDGVACLEFHSKMNVMGTDQIEMIERSLEEVRKKFTGLVIGNQGAHFSAGANLAPFAALIHEQKWDELDLTVQRFQRTTSGLRQFEKPVVAACHGYTLGAGCELVMGCAHAIVAAETRMGLPETGVGLIPGAHGSKEMLIRCTENIPRSRNADYVAGVQQAWEILAQARISGSATEALQGHFLRLGEWTLVLNKDWLIGEAKARVLQMADGYRPQMPRSDIPAVGQTGLANLKSTLYQWHQAGQISEHDLKIGSKLAFILCGGDLTSLHYVTEQYIMDLEREAFLSLCGEPKTVERIQHMLKTGKPLKN